MEIIFKVVPIFIHYHLKLDDFELNNLKDLWKDQMNSWLSLDLSRAIREVLQYTSRQGRRHVNLLLFYFL
jgi:hypothetical protein